MNKKYESPEFEVLKFKFSENVLTVSEGESGTGGGFIHEPDGDEVE